MENLQDYKNDELVVDYWNIDILKSNIEIIFDLFQTTIIFSEPIQIENSSLECFAKEIKVWVSFYGDPKNISKAKKFVCAICDPEFTQRIKLDGNLSNLLSTSYLNGIMANHQVYLRLVREMNENKLLIQGSLNDVSLVKCLIDLDLNKMLYNESNWFDDDPYDENNYDNEDDDDLLIIDKNDIKQSYEKLKNDFDKLNPVGMSKNDQSVLFKLDTESEKESQENPNLNLHNSNGSTEQPKKKRNRRNKNKKKVIEQTNLPQIVNALDLPTPQTIPEINQPSSLISNDDDEDSIQIVNHIEKLNEYYKNYSKKEDIKIDNSSNLKQAHNSNHKHHVNSYPFTLNKNTFENVSKTTNELIKNMKPLSNLMELNVQPSANFASKPSNSQFSFEMPSQINEFSIKNIGEKEKTSKRNRKSKDNTTNNNKKQQHIRSKSVAGLESKKNSIKESNSNNKRYIVIDGSNIAREHGKKDGNVFSCKGIKIVVDYFLHKGHDQITVIIPRFRRGQSDKECPTKNPEILDELENKGYLSYSPSRFVDGQMIVPYDDRFILRAAVHFNAAIVSNDNYRDLMRENDAWKNHIEKNLLQYSFINDLFMIAEDPFGRKGPTLDDYLNLKGNTEIGKHTNSNNFSTSPRKTESKINQPNNVNLKIKTNINQDSNTVNSAIPKIANSKDVKQKFQRNNVLTSELRKNLNQIFPNSKNLIDTLLNQHKNEVEIEFFLSKLLDFSNE